MSFAELGAILDNLIALRAAEAPGMPRNSLDAAIAAVTNVILRNIALAEREMKRADTVTPPPLRRSA